MTRPPGRLARLGRAAAAVAGLAVVLGGPPYALVRLTGWPLPPHVPAWAQVQAFLTSPLSDDAIITGLACVVWLLWALAAVAVLIETAAAVTGRAAPRLPVISPFQAVAAALIGTALVVAVPHPASGPAQPLHAALAAHTAATTAPLTPGPPSPDTPPAPMAAAAQAADSRDPPAALPPVYRVMPGDDLWAIAERYLGDGERWHELYAINAGRPQPGGGTLTDPSLIYPGWVLLLAPPAATAGSPPPAGHSPPPAPAPSPSPATPAPAPSDTPQHDTPGSARTRAAPAGTHAHPRPAAVRLPSGALAGLSVALLVAAALSLARIQRRRRYRPRSRMTDSIQPDEPPLPAVIAALRRAARPALPAASQDASPDQDPEPVTDPYLDPYDDTAPPPGPGGDLPSPRPGPEARPPGQVAADPDGAGASETPGREPGSTPLGVRGTREAVLDIAAAGGLGLTGPGAPAAARGILTALLAMAPPADAGMSPPVIIPAADLTRLLPGQPAEPIPGVPVPASLTAALDEMETALLRHARTSGALDSGDDPTIPIDPGQAGKPAAALIATADPAAAQRLRAILASGRTLGAAAILLGPWPPGVTCHVAADGLITDVTPPGAGLDGIRLFHLGADDTAAIAALLRDAGTIPHPRPDLPPPSPPPAPASRAAGDLRTAQPAPAGYLAAPAMPAPATPAQTADPPPPPPPPPPPRGADPPAPARAAVNGTPAAPETTGPVRLTLLGPLRITAAGKEIRGGLRKARELLAFLAVHHDGATAEAISEALWPDADPGRGDAQRNLALRKARDMLRAATGLSAPMWILNAAGRYRLDPALFSTDLWEFTGALGQARHAGSDDDRLAACRKAAGLYHGELADGAGYEWAEPYAESARRRALDAWTAIAGILQPRDPAQALAALESALGHDPYNEFLYQKIMRLQAEAGHPDAVRRTLSLLETRLTDLGITPGTQTRQVAASLLGATTTRHQFRPADTPAPVPAPHERRAAR